MAIHHQQFQTVHQQNQNPYGLAVSCLLHKLMLLLQLFNLLSRPTQSDAFQSHLLKLN